MSDKHLVTILACRLGSGVVVAAVLTFTGGPAHSQAKVHAGLLAAGPLYGATRTMTSPDPVFGNFCDPYSDVDFLECP